MALSLLYNGPRMAHSPFRGAVNPAMNPTTGLFFVLFLSTNFPNNHDALSLWVDDESGKNVNIVGPIEGVSTDSNNSWLT